jgi:hypothetical protein
VSQDRLRAGPGEDIESQPILKPSGTTAWSAYIEFIQVEFQFMAPRANWKGFLRQWDMSLPNYRNIKRWHNCVK